MVAVLGGLVTFLAVMVAGMWATIRVQREHITELKAQARPPSSAPVWVIRTRENIDPVTVRELPRLFPLEGNDEPTQVCRAP
jgi:hypothetical protein